MRIPLFNRHKCPKCGQEMMKTTILGVMREVGVMDMNDYMKKNWGLVRYLCIDCHIYSK